MTLLQFIGCLVFNVRHYSIILKNKEDANLVLSRILFILLMTYMLINNTQFFILFTIAKTIYDIVTLIIKSEASGVVPSNYKEILIDDLIGFLSFIIYVGG